jgi:hypothetical protein
MSLAAKIVRARLIVFPETSPEALIDALGGETPIK